MSANPVPVRQKGASIAGCRPSLHGGNLVVSTGNAALDTIIGGGCPVGSLVLIEEDKYQNYSRVLTKYFLAEGVQRKHGLFLASLEDDPKETLQTVPRPAENAQRAPNTAQSSAASADEDMRIAFRYNQLPKVDSEIQASSGSAGNYDLSTSIADADLNHLDVTCCIDKESIIRSLKEVASREIYSKSGESEKQNLLRICIKSFGSPLWYTQANFGLSLLSILLQLKAIARNCHSVCFLTVPGQLLNTFDVHLMGQIRNLVDISIEIESFAASDRETNPVFKDYHGLLHIRKLTAVDTLAAFCPETLDLAFKLKRKRFVIEKLHLPPDLGENPDATQKSPALGCASIGGSSGNHLLDF